MPFVESILKHSSISIIGMEKNCGKTVVLNYILSRLVNYDKIVSVTSIGVDGEKVDIITQTAKPEITLAKNVLFATSEIHYSSRSLVSEILAIGEDSSPLGKIVLARVIVDGKVMLSGPGDTPSLKRVIDKFKNLGSDLVIVDGALSRKSLASPSVTDGMILCTGAALSINIDELVSRTKHQYNMIMLPLFESKKELIKIKKGVWSIDEQDCAIDLGINSSLEIEKHRDLIFKHSKTLFFAGMLTDRMLEAVTTSNNAAECVVVVKDFTKLFISAIGYRRFVNFGGEIKILMRSKVEAICINPLSPSGYKIDSEKLVDRLFNELGVPIYDVMKIKK